MRRFIPSSAFALASLAPTLLPDQARA